MYGYEIPVNENAYAARERYLNDKKQAENAMKLKREYTEFISNSRDYFLSEAMNFVLQKALDEETSVEDREYGKALIEGFVKENGSIKLLSEIGRKSLFLAGVADVVKEAHQQVLHSCKEGDSKTFRITKSVDDKFFDKLIGLSDEKICQKINERVCNAIEQHVQANVNDKLDLEELAEKTKEKIDNIKARSEEERQKIEECFTEQYRKQVEAIKQRRNRKVSVYEQLMHSVSQGIVADQSLLESFTNAAGQLNMNKINGKVTVLYTFLEMLNTTKIVDVNEAFIENVLKSI